MKQVFGRIWKLTERLLDEDIEQNVEYWRERETKYVRVPWQLYLLALAAKHNYGTMFSSYTAQRKLSNVVEKIKDSKWIYPHSGKLLSSRTHAILFDVLVIIEKELRGRTFSAVYYLLDRFRSGVGSRAFRIFASIVACGIIVWALWAWVESEGKLVGLGGKVGGVLVLWLAGIGRK